MAATWGEIRFRLSKAHPGVDPDLLDSYINSAYELILDARPWRGLRAEGALDTVAAHADGSVALTNGSATVTGTATAFTAAMTGRRFRRASDSDMYTVEYVSPTELTLDRAYSGATGTQLGYRVFQHIYDLPGFVKYLTDLRAPLGRGIGKKTQDFLNDYYPGRPGHGAPTIWAEAPDSDELAPEIVHRVELYPIPEQAERLPYTFQKAAFAFDGESTSVSPMPWVRTNAIVFRARALIYVDEKDSASADRYEAMANRELDSMHLVESQRRGSHQIEMAARFTEHRMRRGFN